MSQFGKDGRRKLFHDTDQHRYALEAERLSAGRKLSENKNKLRIRRAATGIGGEFGSGEHLK
jgi:hypothetical protein